MCDEFDFELPSCDLPENHVELAQQIVCGYADDEFQMTEDAWPLILQEWERRKQCGHPNPILNGDDIRELLSRGGQ
jgi:hypothetical protein